MSSQIFEGNLSSGRFFDRKKGPKKWADYSLTCGYTGKDDSKENFGFDGPVSIAALALSSLRPKVHCPQSVSDQTSLPNLPFTLQA